MKRKESDMDLFEGLDDLDDGIPEAKKLKLSDDDDLRMEVEPAIGAYPQNTDSAEARPAPASSHYASHTSGPIVIENPTTTMLGDVMYPEIRIRDAFPKQEEKDGILEFKIVQNDGQEDNMIALCYLKDIFSKQLPKMPVEYIARLVFDRKHAALAMIRNKVIIGGIQFRAFKQRNFIEIVFCAVTQTQQVRGYGSYLMNHLKIYAQKEKIYNFLTYADNFAVGYFKKQGFSREIELDRSAWGGVIKDYDGGTLMHCHLSDKIDYMEAPVIVQKQRRFVLETLKNLSVQHQRWQGFSYFAQHQTGKDPLTTVVRLSLDRFQPLLATGWNPESYKHLVHPETQKKILQINRNLLTSFKEDKSSWPFLTPVDGSVVADYYSIVEDPIDLQTIETKMDAGFYLTQDMLYADLCRMLENCKKYNGQGNVYYDCATSLENRYLKKWKPVPID